MKKQIIIILTAGAAIFSLAGCKESGDKNAASTQEKTQQSDSTYLEDQDNNGQPVTDSEGGEVTETKGAPESGYGNANNTELHPSATGPSGSAAGRGSDDEKTEDKE